MTQRKRTAAKRPAPRTITVTGDGEYETWEATARCDFPARWLVDMQGTTNLDTVLGLLQKIVVDHNFPDTEGAIAAELADVDPYDGLLHMANKITGALGRLPPR